MEGIISIFILCGWFGIIILCTILIIYAVLKWLNTDDATRSRRLNIMAGIASLVLCILLVHWRIKKTDGKDFVLTNLFLNFSKISIGGLLFVTITASVLVLLFIVILCIYNGIHTLLSAGLKPESKPDSSKDDKDDSAFINAIRNPIIIRIIAFGIISLFFILPFLASSQKKEDPIEIWKNGVSKIESIFNFSNLKSDINNSSDNKKTDSNENTNNDKNDEENNFPDDFKPDSLASYMLIYIILLGVGYAVIQILSSIIKRALRTQKNRNLIDEYSNPIALLAVGVALLLVLQEDSSQDWYRDKISQLIPALGIVVFVAAIIILTLEIIRLIMDIREDFIRLEARYLFIFLVGLSALLFLGVLNSIYNAVSSAIGIDMDNRLYEIEKKLRKSVIDVMNQTIHTEKKSPPNDQLKNGFKHKTTFNPFDEKITKK